MLSKVGRIIVILTCFIIYITKYGYLYFCAKKRAWSDQCNNGFKPKQLLISATMATNQSNFRKKVQHTVVLLIHFSTFSKKVWSLDCMEIQLNCLQNLDKHVKEFCILAQSSNEKHSKGEKDLSVLPESISFRQKV